MTWLIVIIAGYVIADAWVRASRAQKGLANLVGTVSRLANMIDEVNERIEELESRSPASYGSVESELEPDMMWAPEAWHGKSPSSKHSEKTDREDRKPVL